MPTQLFVTHCKSDESLRGDNGFTIRASSPCDAALQNWARSLAMFKLPTKMDSRSATEELPRRLAFAHGANGNRALIHSLAVAFDSTGTRTGNYFSHAFLASGSALDLKTAVQAWGSPDWTLATPPGFGTQLPERPAVPHGLLINDETLREFLSNVSTPSRDEPLNRVVFPKRLSDPQKRRTLVRQFLQGVWICNPAAQAANRKRLLVHAEPGLVALLLYAAARLLPARLTDPLTFSLYESFTNDLVYYKEGLVVGTYDPDQTLQPVKYTAYGFTLDTIQNVASADVRDPKPALAILDEMIRLAGQPDGFARIDRIHDTFAKTLFDKSGAPDVAGLWKTAMELEERYHRFLSGQAAPDDLKRLNQEGFGSLISDVKSRPTLIKKLTDWWDAGSVLADYHPIYESETEVRSHIVARVAEAVAKGDKAAFDKAWASALQTLKDPNAGRKRLLEEVLSKCAVNPNADIAIRCALLKEWLHPQSVGATAKPPEWLLAASSLSQLQTLTRDVKGLPQPWLACAAFSLIPAMNDADVHKLFDAARPAMQPLMQLILKSPNVRTLIAHSLPPGQKSTPALFGMLYDAGLRGMPADALATAVIDAGGSEPAWDDFWLAFPTQRSVTVLCALASVPSAEALMQRLARRFTDLATPQCVIGSREDRTRLLVLNDLAKALNNPPFEDFRTRVQNLESLQYVLSGEQIDTKFNFPAFAKALGIGSWRELIGARLINLQNDGLLNEDALSRHAKAIRNIYVQDGDRGFEPWLDATSKLKPENRDVAHHVFLNLVSSPDARRKLIYNQQQRLSSGLVAKYRPQSSSTAVGRPLAQPPLASAPKLQDASATSWMSPRLWFPAVICLSVAVVLLAVGLAVLNAQNRDLAKRNTELQQTLNPTDESPSRTAKPPLASSSKSSTPKPDNSKTSSGNLANTSARTEDRSQGASSNVVNPPETRPEDLGPVDDDDATASSKATFDRTSVFYSNFVLPLGKPSTVAFSVADSGNNASRNSFFTYHENHVYKFELAAPNIPPTIQDSENAHLLSILSSKGRSDWPSFYKDGIFVGTQNLYDAGDSQQGAGLPEYASSDPLGELIAFCGTMRPPDPKPENYKKRSYISIKKKASNGPEYKSALFEVFKSPINIVAVAPSKVVWVGRADNTFWRYDNEVDVGFKTMAQWDGWVLNPPEEADVRANPIRGIVPLRTSTLFLLRENGVQCWFANHKPAKTQGPNNEKIYLLNKVADIPGSARTIAVTPSLTSSPLLVVGQKDGSIMAYKISAQPQAKNFQSTHQILGTHLGVDRLLFSWDGKWLAATGDSKVSIWRVDWSNPSAVSSSQPMPEESGPALSGPMGKAAKDETKEKADAKKAAGPSPKSGAGNDSKKTERSGTPSITPDRSSGS